VTGVAVVGGVVVVTRSLVGIVILNAVVSAGLAQAAAAAGPQAPRNLRCEYRQDPLGIDVRAPRLSWEVVDARRGAVQRAYRVLVADDPALLQREEGNLWDSGQVESDQSIQVVYAGKPLRSRVRVWWQVRMWDADGQGSPWSAPATWSMGLFELADWGAQWIGDAQEPPGGNFDPLTPPMLRKAFTLDSTAPVTRATVYVTALGLYELRINGQRVGDHVLAPEWTDYHQRVQYQTYDVTKLIAGGENVVGAQLGDGWYAGRVGLAGIVNAGPPRAIYGRQPRLLLRLEIERGDQPPQVVVSDGSWVATTEGPIRFGDLLDGETYDARRELAGWDGPGCDAVAWRPVAARALEPGKPALLAQPNEPVRITRVLKPIGIAEPKPGAYVFDLGQNMVGWCRFKVHAPAGTTVTLRHAEVLNPDGTIYTENLRSAKQTDQYTCRGGEAETFEPHFTYHGFRYVEVTGLPYKPALEDLAGCVVHSSAPEVGQFECSDALLNKLWSNILWTQRANLTSVPTDCPQRDERCGWMGDILAFAQTACFNMDMAAFYTKWIPDVRDAQTPDGRYPDFAPHPFEPAVRFSSVAAWGDAGVFVPWCAYVNYADRRLLEQHFDSARRWVDYVHEQNPELLWKNSRGNDYGDWLNADTLKLEGWPEKGAEVPKEVFATMFFARSTELVAQMARVLGRNDAAQQYGMLAERIRAAFNAAYVSPDGRMQGNTQAGYALALYFDLLPKEQRAAAAKYMLEAFETYKGNISTGFHSTIALMSELTRSGRNDEAYRLILNRTMPSWGYAIDHGATTIWERWDGYVEGRGFQNPGMNSFSHYAIGSVGEWMYRTILGINPDETHPGYKHFILRPLPGGGLTWARGSYHSPHGEIACAWKLADGKLTLNVRVPPNTTATVYVPDADPKTVTESGQPAAQTLGVLGAKAEDGAAVFRVGAGRYAFER